jgi:hypothetical protein
MNAAEFKQRLAQIPLVQGGYPVRQIPDPAKVEQLCGEALYSISVNGDLVSRRLVAAIFEAKGMKVHG